MAKPRKQQCIPPIRPHLAHDDAHGALHNLFRQGRVVVDPAQGEAEESGKILFEERVESRGIALRHARCETAVLLDLWDFLGQRITRIRSVLYS